MISAEVKEVYVTKITFHDTFEIKSSIFAVINDFFSL